MKVSTIFKAAVVGLTSLTVIGAFAGPAAVVASPGTLAQTTWEGGKAVVDFGVSIFTGGPGGVA